MELSRWSNTLWVPAMPAKYIFICALFVPRHSSINPDPHLATLILSPTLSFVLSSKDKLCFINQSSEVLGSGISAH
jgi:hypothetical protein